MLRRMVSVAVVVIFGAVGLLNAQQAPPIKRTILQKVDVPGSNYEAVIGIAEIAPNVSVGRHTHPGTEAAYVLEGDLTLLVDGQPPVALKAGDSAGRGPRRARGRQGREDPGYLGGGEGQAARLARKLTASWRSRRLKLGHSRSVSTRGGREDGARPWGSG